MNTWSHSNTYWVTSSISHIWPGLVTPSTNSHLTMMQCSVHIHIGLRCNARVLLLVSYKSWCWGGEAPLAGHPAWCLAFSGPRSLFAAALTPCGEGFPVFSSFRHSQGRWPRRGWCLMGEHEAGGGPEDPRWALRWVEGFSNGFPKSISLSLIYIELIC
jgi:hypothetical protein